MNTAVTQPQDQFDVAVQYILAIALVFLFSRCIACAPCWKTRTLSLTDIALPDCAAKSIEHVVNPHVFSLQTGCALLNSVSQEFVFSMFLWCVCERVLAGLLCTPSFTSDLNYSREQRVFCYCSVECRVGSVLASGVRINGLTYEPIYWLSGLPVPACLSISRNTPVWRNGPTERLVPCLGQRRPARFLKEAADAEGSRDNFWGSGGTIAASTQVSFKNATSCASLCSLAASSCRGSHKSSSLS